MYQEYLCLSALFPDIHQDRLCQVLCQCHSFCSHPTGLLKRLGYSSLSTLYLHELLLSPLELLRYHCRKQHLQSIICIICQFCLLCSKVASVSKDQIFLHELLTYQCNRQIWRADEISVDKIVVCICIHRSLCLSFQYVKYVLHMLLI